MGTPVWFSVYIEGLATFVGSCRLLFSDKEEPIIYNIWHLNLMLKISSASGAFRKFPQAKLRSSRRSPMAYRAQVPPGAMTSNAHLSREQISISAGQNVKMQIFMMTFFS